MNAYNWNPFRDVYLVLSICGVHSTGQLLSDLIDLVCEPECSQIVNYVCDTSWAGCIHQALRRQNAPETVGNRRSAAPSVEGPTASQSEAAEEVDCSFVSYSIWWWSVPWTWWQGYCGNVLGHLHPSYCKGMCRAETAACRLQSLSNAHTYITYSRSLHHTIWYRLIWRQTIEALSRYAVTSHITQIHGRKTTLN